MTSELGYIDDGVYQADENCKGWFSFDKFYKSGESRFLDAYYLNKFNLSNGKVVLAPSLCGENCFRVIRDMSDCISFPDDRNESLIVIFKKPI